MSATLDLPITIKNLSPEIIRWLLVKSSETGKSTDQLTKEILERFAKRDGVKKEGA